ncbi:RsmB/NOP family class I SAM-dependent RNA methyltransferase [Microlunatus speluncae]|uniref:RsmB/NOP family class I SAM-dependent RNA methyltransferase n=1 Tax=Microlunatus speluncae TaxID=2594267 RepID=UPI0012667720|nr:transcription antitermination factor NusB [Microlunatus speluncae]
MPAPPRGQQPRDQEPRDPARRAALDALLAVELDGAYLNLELNRLLAERGLSGRDAAFSTELAAGTSRLQGTYDRIVGAASGRDAERLDPPVRVLLRLGTHQLLSMRVPAHAAVASTVELAREAVGPKITGLINAVLRKVGADDYAGWLDRLGRGLEPTAALALRTAHPRWIVQAYADVLPAEELEPALLANNEPAAVTLAVRPGLAEVAELIEAGARPGRWSPYAATWQGAPAELAAIRQGRAGVQDEGSQLVAAGLAAVPINSERPQTGVWLDLCAGPGGKTALLGGLARQSGSRLVAVEISQHRAELVRSAVRGLGPTVEVIMADGTDPAWVTERFDRVLADVPCSGLGSLRRRPESRWRREPAALNELVPLQRRLLAAAIDAAAPGGVIGYVTCSPHRRETVEVVEATLAERDDVETVDSTAVLAAVGLSDLPDATLGPYLQLWPHRHGTDAMFAAYLRRR